MECLKGPRVDNLQNNPNLNSAGVAIQGLGITGVVVHDNLITGNRTGIDVNDSGVQGDFVTVAPIGIHCFPACATWIDVRKSLWRELEGFAIQAADKLGNLEFPNLGKL